MTRRYWERATCLSRKTEAKYATTKKRRNILKRLFSLHSSKQSATLQVYASGYSSENCPAAGKFQSHDPEVRIEEVQGYGE